MVGQGRPKSKRAAIGGALARGGGWLLALAMWTAFASSVRADDTQMRLRIAWGGGQTRRWQGEIAVPGGQISNLRRLDAEASGPSTFQPAADRILIRQDRPSGYDGLDFQVRAPAEAKVLVRLAPFDAPSEAEEFELDLSSLVADFQNQAIDDQGNRLLIRRAPGDRLRVEFDRPSLVFRPGETFEFSVVRNQLEPEQAPLAMTVRLRKSGQDEVLWETERAAPSGAKENDASTESSSLDNAGPPAERFSVTLPAEGVYDISISLNKPRIPAPFVSQKQVLSRKIQVVAVDDQRPPGRSDASWRTVMEIDPANPKWWERLGRWPHLKLIPSTTIGPLDNQRSEQWEHHGRKVTSLQPGGWQAFPLPVSAKGEPHMLEIEYPADIEQTFGVSIVEPNAAGFVRPFGLDSGVIVEPVEGSPRVMRHRLFYWPRSDSPVAIIVNRDAERRAVFGKLIVRAGPSRLQPQPEVERQEAVRLVAALFEKPLFPETFFAPQTQDNGQRSLTDWNTFYLGGGRMIDYAKYVGYNALVVGAISEGSSLYPSRWLRPSAKYDNGVRFITGQDPIRKDVLELLFRLCDRENIRLIPSLDLSMRLPELEAVLQNGGPPAAGIRWTDRNGALLAQNTKASRSAPRYNPLNSQVQAAVLRVVGELVERYSEHRSFAGISLRLGPETYAQLPGEECGFDDNTIARFEKAVGLKVPGSGADRFSVRAKFLLGGERLKWLRWRASELGQFHDNIQQVVSQKRPEAVLYLAPTGLAGNRPIRSALAPKLPRREKFSHAMLQIGMAPELHAENPKIVVLRPRIVGPQKPLLAKATQLQLNELPEVENFFTPRNAAHGDVFFHQPQPQRLASFDAVSPFGSDKTYTWLAPGFSYSGSNARRYFVRSLARRDAATFFAGGWSVATGQEAALQPLFDVFRRLPARRFDDVAPRNPRGGSQPVVIRKQTVGDATYMYLLNDSPWNVSLDLELRAPTHCRVRSLSSRELPPLDRMGETITWRIELAPYDLIGAVFSVPRVDVDYWRATLPGGAIANLRKHTREVAFRASEVRRPPRIDVLENPGFELPANGDKIPGWRHAFGPGVEFEVETIHPQKGRHSLRMQSVDGKSPAWIRSEPFAPPKTGRLAFLVYVRTADPAQQPVVRLSFEGEYLDGRPNYYKLANVGGSEDGEETPPLASEWRSYLWSVPDLPVGELRNIQVGVDLMSKGEIWIDHFQVYDLWFDNGQKNELNELANKIVAPAVFHLNEGDVADCLHVLDGYWPRFLMTHVKLPPSDATDQPAARISTRPEKPNSKKQTAPSMLERIKDRIFPFF